MDDITTQFPDDDGRYKEDEPTYACDVEIAAEPVVAKEVDELIEV
jgi:hypothetical protein